VTDPPPPPGTVDADLVLSDKLIHHAECITHASESVLRSRGRYVSWLADPKAGPTGSEKNVAGVYVIPPAYVASCKKELKAASVAKKDATTDTIDKLATSYEAALDAVTPLVVEALRYYEQKDYQDDAFKKGKAMHPALMKAFDDFVAADAAMKAELARLRTGIAERQLTTLEKANGKNLLWHARKISLLSGAIEEVVTAPADALDLAKLDAAIKSLDAEIADTEVYAGAHKPETDKLMTFPQVLDAAKDFLRAAKAFMRQKRDKRPFSAAEVAAINAGTPQLVEGHQAEVVDRYDKYVTKTNAVRW